MEMLVCVPGFWVLAPLSSPPNCHPERLAGVSGGSLGSQLPPRFEPKFRALEAVPQERGLQTALRRTGVSPPPSKCCASRAAAKRKSESRLTYCRATGSTPSTPFRRTKDLSVRRQMVRATWSWQQISPPAGMIKLAMLGRY
eukprot:RCo039402